VHLVGFVIRIRPEKINLVHEVFTALLLIHKLCDILVPYVTDAQYYRLVGCDTTRLNISEATADLRSQGRNL